MTGYYVMKHLNRYNEGKINATATPFKREQLSSKMIENLSPLMFNAFKRVYATGLQSYAMNMRAIIEHNDLNSHFVTSSNFVGRIFWEKTLIFFIFVFY